MYDQQKGFFDSIPSKPSFIFGLVSGLAFALILGMVFMLSGGISISEGTSVTKSTTTSNSGTVKSAAAAAPSANTVSAGAVPTVTDADHIRGDVDAPITLIEYSDYECPFCKRFHPTLLQMMDEYDGVVRWVYRHFPLSFHDPLATAEAMAAECANDLGGNDMFWEMSDLIFERTASNGRGLDIDSLPAMGAELGLDEVAMKECIDSEKFKVHITEDAQGGAAAGVTGTPGSFIIDASGDAVSLKGALPYSSIRAAIEAAL